MVSTIRRTLTLLTLATATIFPQSPTFEAASVRLTIPGQTKSGPGMTGGPGTNDPGRIVYSGITLATVLLRAYDLRQFQLSAPDWVSTTRFDIAAVLPRGSNEEQFRMMLQNLLTERFRIVSHRETKEITALELTAAKGGPRLKAVTPAIADANAGTAAPPHALANGNMALFQIGPTLHMTGRFMSISGFADFLGRYLRRPVFDISGLQGVYNIDLIFQPGSGAETAAPEPAADSIFTALKAQYGLELKSARRPIEMFVVDHADKLPAES